MKKALYPAVLFFAAVLSVNAQSSDSADTNKNSGSAEKSEKIVFTDAMGIWAASSELEKPVSGSFEIGRYSPALLFDNDPATSWVEGKEGFGRGEYVLIGITSDKLFPDTMEIRNGYQENTSLFYKNNRVKDLEISMYAGFYSDMDLTQSGFSAEIIPFGSPEKVMLKDEMGFQQIKLNFDRDDFNRFADSLKKNDQYALTVIKLKILSVYKGTRWDDTCIADVIFRETDREIQDFAPSAYKLQSGEIAVDVYEDSEGKKIFAETSEGRTLLLTDASMLAKKLGYTGNNEFLTLFTADLSPDGNWTVIGYEHGFSDSSSDVETTYHLWYLPQMRPLPDKLATAYNISVSSPPYFKKSGSFLLIYSDNGSSAISEDLALDMESGNWQ